MGTVTIYNVGDYTSAFEHAMGLIVADLAALQDPETTAVAFKSVGAYLFEPKATKTPAVGVFPINDPDVDNGITNVGTETAYRFGVGIGLKGFTDSKMLILLLRFRDIIKRYFETGRDYSVMPGFVRVTVESQPVTYESESPKGVLMFNSGIIISVEVTRLKGS